MSTLRSYIQGYLLSIVLTLAAFGLLTLHLPVTVLAVLFIALALLQLLVQLVFFLHLGTGANKYWNTVALIFALSIVVVLTGGTLWIMNNLKHTSQNNFINGQINVFDEND